YFCNFSIFQSMPDSWAINQLFPILPIHRLNEPPTRRAVLGDITCDSDGKIDQFIDLRGVRSKLELDPYDGRPDCLGAVLVGAYQEILGDLHNLFGDTNAVHVSLDDDGEINLDAVIKGDTVREVLAYVQYSADELLARMRKDVERAVRQGKISLNESRLLLRLYESGLEGYTYLEEPQAWAERGEDEDGWQRCNDKWTRRLRHLSTNNWRGTRSFLDGVNSIPVKPQFSSLARNFTASVSPS